MVSTGMGRTTCAYFLPDNKSFVYGSTHLADKDCPEVPLRKNGRYVWPVYDSFDIFVADLEGNITGQLTDLPGYDAEATVSPKGDKIVFTSTRSGDLELYTMNLDGTDVQQITDELGYDGGAFFSPDGTKLIFRSSRPKTEEAISKYKGLLAEGLVEPTNMELYICDADGSNMKQLTNLGNANWSPFFTPDGKRILFSSNYESERGFPFNLYMIDIDGKNLERITHGETFDAFPVFSNDGKHLIFSSNRNNGGGRDTNLFIAEWQD
jgi:TolB protein